MQLKFEHGFEKMRDGYRGLLGSCIRHRKIFVIGFFAVCALSFLLLPWLGQDFFPAVDSGEFKLHMRAPTGTRIEDTAAICDRVEQDIRRHIPPEELDTIIDNIGLPYSSINLSYSNSAPTGPADADIDVALKGNHHHTEQIVRNLRPVLGRDFPGVTFFELPVDMVSQILNFGLPAPIDIQVVGPNLAGDRAFASQLLNRLKFIPGTADLRIQQTFNYPKLTLDVDRTKASQIGYTQLQVANNILVSLSGSFQTSPTFWLDPKTGVSYQIATQTPQYRIQSFQDLDNIPLAGGTPPSTSPAIAINVPLASASPRSPIAIDVPATGASMSSPPAILGSVATISRSSEMAVVSHYDVQPVIDIYGSVQGRDLGGVAREIDPILKQSKSSLPRGSQIIVRGQILTMRSSFNGLLGGLFFSIVLVYLLIVVNFQSWLDPFIILMALPAALAGIVWFLFITGTTISVPGPHGNHHVHGRGHRQ